MVQRVENRFIGKIIILIKFFNVMFAALLLALIFYLGASKALHSFWHSENLIIDSGETFSVSPGSSLNQVIGQLVGRGVLESRSLTKLAIRYYEPNLVLKAGEYRLPDSPSRAQLFALLASGVSVQYPVTIVEGFTAIEAYSALAQQSVNSRDLHRPLSAALIEGQLRDVLSDAARDMMGGNDASEGWFFPDTYHVVKVGATIDVFRRAHQNMVEVLQAEWDLRQADLPYAGAYEALIMASLIEKETGAIEEREAIAGVFVRRLQKRMRLQTDPSVIYGLGSDFKGNLTREHLRRDTLYNTYSRHGLPPTPIALPGREAIRAALHPAAGETLYFVAKGDGSHHFSVTYKEHQRAVQQYQILNRRSNYQSAPKVGPG